MNQDDIPPKAQRVKERRLQRGIAMKQRVTQHYYKQTKEIEEAQLQRFMPRIKWLSGY